MSLIKRNENFSNLATVLDDLFTGEVLHGFARRFNDHHVPAVNVKETKDHFILEMAAPGFRKEDFKIELNNDQLTISSERKNEENGKQGNYSHKEFSYRSFSRSFKLPDTVETDKINAQYTDGVLILNLPLKEKSKPDYPKHIQIS